MLNLKKRRVLSVPDNALDLKGVNYEKIDTAKISELISKKIVISIPCKNHDISEALGENILFARYNHMANKAKIKSIQSRFRE